MATPAELESAPSCVTGKRSSLLNYGAIFFYLFLRISVTQVAPRGGFLVATLAGARIELA